MSELRKVDVFDAGLTIAQRTCALCDTSFLKTFPAREHPNNTIGIQCRRCTSLIWMNGRYGPLKKKWADYDGQDKLQMHFSLEDNRIWLSKLNAELFSQLPVCPCCGAHDYEIFNVMKQLPCPSCGSLEVDISSVKDVTNQHYAEDVWWFGPLRV